MKFGECYIYKIVICGGCKTQYLFPRVEPGYNFICPACNPKNYNGLATKVKEDKNDKT